MSQKKIGDRVRLREVTPDMAERGLKVGMWGIVRQLPEGNLGVEFEGYSDTGWNEGLHVISTGYRRADGSYVLAIDLCDSEAAAPQAIPDDVIARMQASVQEYRPPARLGGIDKALSEIAGIFGLDVDHAGDSTEFHEDDKDDYLQ